MEAANDTANARGDEEVHATPSRRPSPIGEDATTRPTEPACLRAVKAVRQVIDDEAALADVEVARADPSLAEALAEHVARVRRWLDALTGAPALAHEIRLWSYQGRCVGPVQPDDAFEWLVEHGYEVVVQPGPGLPCPPG